MKVISRSEAKNLDLKRFYTGKPCVNGHLSERHAGNGQCIECRSSRYDKDSAKRYNYSYRSDNKERLSAYDRERYARDSELKKASSRAYYHANREKCRASSKAWRENNKDRIAKQRREHYESNRERILDLSRKHRLRNSAAVVARVAKWRKDNPEKKRALHAKRRAGKLRPFPHGLER